MNVLITGGNGFLGSALAENFLNNDYNVNLLIRPESNLKRIKNKLENYNIFKYSSTLDFKNIIIQSNPDIIIHTACNYGRNNDSISSIFDTNYRLGLLILNEIVQQNKQVVFINIGTVLSSNNNLYSFSKNQFSDLGKFISKKHLNLRFKNILLQHMYGPGDDDSKFTTYVIKSCLKNLESIDLTSGEQKRDFIYIKDVVSAITKICSNIEVCEDVDIEIGSGELIAVKEFVKLVHTKSNSNTKLNFGAIINLNDEIIPAANLEKMSKFRWVPQYNIEQGIIETIKNEMK